MIPAGWGKFVRGTEQHSAAGGAASSQRAKPDASGRGAGACSVSSRKRSAAGKGAVADTQRTLTDALPNKRRKAPSQQHVGAAVVKDKPFCFKTITEAAVAEQLIVPAAPGKKSSAAGAAAAAGAVSTVVVASTATYDNSTERSVYDAVRHSISRYMNVEMIEDTLDLDTVLSRVPYQYMLETLFGGDDLLPDDVPIITRVYEESFMRECVGRDEQPCVNGRTCECMFIDANIPFVGTEFLLPGESTSKENPQMCVLCSRKTTQQLFHDMLYCGVSFRAVIQRFGNICNQPGEYARECMLICPPSANVHCMPLPIVAHQRNRYSVSLCNGVKFLRQHRVYYEHYHASGAAAPCASSQPFH